MSPKPVLFGVLVAGCVASAGAGAWLASRPSDAAASAAPAAAANAAAVAKPADDLKTAAVSETETVVAPTDPAANPPVATVPVELEKPGGRTAPSSPSRRERREPARRESPRAAPPVDSAPVATAPAAAPVPASVEPPPAINPARPVDPPAAPVAPAAPVNPPAPVKTFEELVIAANSVLGLQLDTAVSSETAKIEDRIEARVTRDVRVGGEVAIPSGTRVLGSVTTVERGGKFKERARLGVRFHTIVLADGTRLPMKTETVFREGNGQGRETTAKVGGAAAGGAILGALLGGKKGAAIGTAIGAGAGTAAVAAGDRSLATMPAGTTLTVRLSDPVSVTIEK